jgi:hypothetical protein
MAGPDQAPGALASVSSALLVWPVGCKIYFR